LNNQFIVMQPSLVRERRRGIAHMGDGAALVQFGIVAIQTGQSFGRRSALADAPVPCEVLLLDTIGELARAYRHADLAFIGGSLVATGGHNPLEPAVWAVPVLSGPHVFNFREVYDELVAAGGVRLVADGRELERAISEWLANPESARKAGLAGRAVIEANRGATARTVEALLALADRGREAER
jgi:3-deoxy-D-manno-octulosonic-acid transferase